LAVDSRMSAPLLKWNNQQAWQNNGVGSGNGRQLNQLKMCIVRRDRMWLSTQ
jgi:hypothetical protein